MLSSLRADRALRGALLAAAGLAAGMLVGARRRSADADRRRREDALRRESEARLRQAAIVFDNTNEAIIITDPDTRILAVNRAYETITGFSAHEVLGLTPKLHHSGLQDSAFYTAMWDSLMRTGQWQGQMWNRHKDGSLYPAWQNISAVKDEDGRVTYYVSVLSDITAIKQVEERLHHLAHHDALTELPNRLLFDLTLEKALERAQRHGRRVALLSVDLDHFKLVNDTLGHEAGDALLREVGVRLRSSVRGEDTVARLGGDEFVVLLEEAGNNDDVALTARKLIAAVAEPMELNGRPVVASSSIGISLYPDDADSASALARAADAALYRAKDTGRRTFCFHTEEMTRRAAERQVIENGLREALNHGELLLHYQPQFDAVSGRVAGVEALLRWQHPHEGLLLPARFLGVAEESGLIDLIGEWVIGQVCRQAAEWTREGCCPPRIAINLSNREFLYEHVGATLSSAMEACGLDPQRAGGCRIEVEITEAVLQSAEQSQYAIESLRELGIGITIGDFGTGYSPLGMLNHLPVDTLKIGRHFVSGLPNDRDSRAMAGTIVSIARSLGLHVSAEGVETPAQLAFLRDIGCQEVQGYLCGVPLPADAISERLALPASIV